MEGNDDTFFKVTNRDIYDQLIAQNAKLEKIEQHVIATNGKVKLARWVATTALSMVTAVVLFLAYRGV